MTKRQRAAVVELLRCAADAADGFDPVSGFSITSYRLGTNSFTRLLACRAFPEINGEEGDDWVAACLEAAQRVEDCVWP